MAHRFKLLAFDLDGTLINSLGMIEIALNEALAQSQLPTISGNVLREPIGLALDECIRYWIETVVPGKSALPEQIEKVSADYRKYFLDLRKSGALGEPLFDGVRETLDELQDLEQFMAVVTGKDMPGLLRVIEHHKLGHYFDDNLNTPTHYAGKPSPQMVYGAAEKAMQSLDDTVVIGDSVFDIQMAQNAGVMSVGVSYGNHSVERLLAAGANIIIDRFSDLPKALEEISSLNVFDQRRRMA